MKLNTLLFVLTLIFCSCANDDDAPSTSVTNYLGTWKWVSTDGGYQNQLHYNPNSDGHNYTIKIQSDNYMIIYKDDELIGNYPFHISLVLSISNRQKTPYMLVGIPDTFSEPHIVISGTIQTDGNQLIISDNYPDGLVGTFTKIN